MSQAPTPTDRIKRPLDAAKLDELALAYVARFATSKGKLARYLSRKVRESKWIDAQDSNEVLAVAVAKMERLGYLDDRHYAQMKSGAMMRRGLGPQRVRAQLRFDGVDEADSDAAIRISDDERLMAAVRFARRKRLGPFAAEAMRDGPDDRARREKQVAAFLRAGHDMGLARRILAMAPMDMPQPEEVVAWLNDE
ncbi:MAG TPA: RecX family transcriptional regulator [Sphingopyxis sp.]|nr:RecX family transcriptional regulator [Sphingopyxis sp.]